MRFDPDNLRAIDVIVLVFYGALVLILCSSMKYGFPFEFFPNRTLAFRIVLLLICIFISGLLIVRLGGLRRR